MLAEPQPREHRSAIEQFKRPAEQAEEALDALRPHKVAYRATARFSAESLMLEVCLKDGRCRFFDAASCVDMAYEPGETILVLYPTTVLIMVGRRLGEAASLLKQHRCAFVQEEHDAFAPESEPYIEKISFRNPKEWYALLKELEGTGRIAESKGTGEDNDEP